MQLYLYGKANEMRIEVYSVFKGRVQRMSRLPSSFFNGSAMKQFYVNMYSVATKDAPDASCFILEMETLYEMLRNFHNLQANKPPLVRQDLVVSYRLYTILRRWDITPELPGTFRVCI